MNKQTSSESDIFLQIISRGLELWVRSKCEYIHKVKLEINTNLIHKKKPDECPCCSSDNVKGLEVIGTYDGNLFWECYECESVFLRFNAKTTLKYLEKAIGLWTNPEDWAYVPRSEFN